MAAILEPRRHDHLPPRRPALRLVSGDGGRTVTMPVDLGIGPGHVMAALAALVVVLAFTIAVSSGALAGLAPAPSSAGDGRAPAAAGPVAGAATTSVLVQPGDTMWSIARRLQPTGDVRPLVDQLVAANGTASIQAGQEIVIPG